MKRVFNNMIRPIRHYYDEELTKLVTIKMKISVISRDIWVSVAVIWVSVAVIYNFVAFSWFTGEVFYCLFTTVRN